MTNHVIESRGATVTVDTDTLQAMWNRLALHGLEQKVGDAAAGALADCGHGKAGDGKSFGDLTDAEKDDVRVSATASMQKVIDALVTGEWGVERSGSTADPIMAETYIILRPDTKLTYDAEHGKDAWKALDESARVDAMDEMLAGQDDATKAQITALAESNIAKKAEIAAAKKGLGKLSLKRA